MDLLTFLGTVLVAVLLAFCVYVVVAVLLATLAYRLAAAQEQIPRSLDCRNGRHRGCVTCSCTCHP